MAGKGCQMPLPRPSRPSSLNEQAFVSDRTGLRLWPSRPSSLTEQAFVSDRTGLRLWPSRPSSLTEQAFVSDWAGLRLWPSRPSSLTEQEVWASTDTSRPVEDKNVAHCILPTSTKSNMMGAHLNGIRKIYLTWYQNDTYRGKEVSSTAFSVIYKLTNSSFSCVCGLDG